MATFLVFAAAGGGGPSLPFALALGFALCFGTLFIVLTAALWMAEFDRERRERARWEKEREERQKQAMPQPKKGVPPKKNEAAPKRK